MAIPLRGRPFLCAHTVWMPQTQAVSPVFGTGVCEHLSLWLRIHRRHCGWTLILNDCRPGGWAPQTSRAESRNSGLKCCQITPGSIYLVPACHSADQKPSPLETGDHMPLLPFGNSEGLTNKTKQNNKPPYIFP